jgi:hypothetical protein
MGAKLLTGSILAVIGLFTVKLVLWLVAGVAAFLGFILFTVLPIVLIGWLVLKFLGRSRHEPAS